MDYTPPNKIKILSDDNILEFVKVLKNKTGDLYLFRFVVSIEKLGLEVEFTEKEIVKNLNNFFKIIE